MCRAAASSSRRRSIISSSTLPAAFASMSAPRPAASPKCCSRAARGASTRSMSAAASCIPAARPDRDRRYGTNRHSQARSIAFRRTAGFRHRRCQLHLAQACLPAIGVCSSRAQPGGADQAAIRGAAPRHQERHRARRGDSCAVCDDIVAFLAALGWRVGGVVPSPILGGDGNCEFFLEAERG